MPLPPPPVRPDPTRVPTEQELREDLAAAYRLIALHGMTDLVFTHLSVRVPGEGHRFLVNPYGLLFEEITASSLVLVDAEGAPAQKTSWPVNPAGGWRCRGQCAGWAVRSWCGSRFRMGWMGEWPIARAQGPGPSAPPAHVQPWPVHPAGHCDHDLSCFGLVTVRRGWLPTR